MKLTGVAVFAAAAGYVVGAKAGRERYAQIIDGMARASQTLEAFSDRRPPGRQGPGRAGADGDPRSEETAV